MRRSVAAHLGDNLAQLAHLLVDDHRRQRAEELLGHQVAVLERVRSSSPPYLGMGGLVVLVVAAQQLHPTGDLFRIGTGVGLGLFLLVVLVLVDVILAVRIRLPRPRRCLAAALGLGGGLGGFGGDARGFGGGSLGGGLQVGKAGRPRSSGAGLAVQVVGVQQQLDRPGEPRQGRLDLGQAFLDALGDGDFASRVSNSTVPISRMYMRTGSVVRPTSASVIARA